MFDDRLHCLQMLKGSYRKLKSYYYYNKNYIIMREKIAQFESNRSDMLASFDNLCQLIMHPDEDQSINYFDGLLARIDFCVLPKKFGGETSGTDRIATNAIPKNKKLRAVNFFADFPIELFILDTLWTLFLGKISDDLQLLSSDVYGNTIANHLLYKKNGGTDDIMETINFSTARLFNIYYYKYCSWRNSAFDTLEYNHSKKKSSVLISLDVQSYYYNVRFDFNMRNLLGEHSLIESISELTALVHQIYYKYFNVIRVYRNGFEQLEETECPLPIGLFSSMLIANIYLSKFDKMACVTSLNSYYGRYVDDLLFCFVTNDDPDIGLTQIIQNTLVANGILDKKSDSSYCLAGFSNLPIQKDKIKILHISADESRALLDIYNENVRVIPSQMNILPDYDLRLSDFNESAYTIENFGKEFKIRDVGNVNIDAFKVSRYFSTLAFKQGNLHSFDSDSKSNISNQIKKIADFFVGSQSLEYYSNWMNYAYFLVLSRKYSELKKFYMDMKKNIEKIKGATMERDTFRKGAALSIKTRQSLNRHLEISIATALALDITATMRIDSLKPFRILAEHLMDSNMFNHSLVSLPIANYLDYDIFVAYARMDVADYGRIPKGFQSAFMVEWSPRFVHFEELQLAVFLHNHNHQKKANAGMLSYEKLIDIYYAINHIKSQDRFAIKTQSERIGTYTLRNIAIPSYGPRLEIATIAVGNIKMRASDCSAVLKNRWAGLTRQKKQALRDLLVETYNDSYQKADLLVLPELYIPIYWLKEVVDFSKRTQIAIITGLQYIAANDNYVKNYVATILPFRSGRQLYKSAFVFIREKNDYSPIEKEGLAKAGKRCLDANDPNYQIFHWNGVDLTAFVCFEFTDLFARALFKGKCDIIAAPVFNSDTTYFSNIIDSATRDLHTIIVQANNSVYGDSRITGPYDRDNKDIIKIKGGENDHIIIGKVNLNEILRYQAEYYDKQEATLTRLREKKNIRKEEKKRPDIKKLSARFNNARARQKLNR